MTAFRAAHSSHVEPKQAVAQCLAALGRNDGCNLGFVYATDYLAASLPQIVATLRAETGIADWTGTAGLGVLANGRDSSGVEDGVEYFDRPGLAVMLASLPAGKHLLFEPVHGGMPPFERAHRSWLERNLPLFGVVHADPRNPHSAEIIADLSAATGAFLVGGLTASRDAFPQVTSSIVEGGVSGVLFAAGTDVATGLTQGCSPLGLVHEITDAEDNVVKTLDGEPALAVYEKAIGEILARDLRRAITLVHAALPVTGSDTGDYLVRNIVGIDPARGWIAIGDEVATGGRLVFVRRDPAAAREDMTRMLGRLTARMKEPPKGALYHACVARGRHMFGEDGAEIAMIRESLGDIPLVGFFANGEICHNRLYGYTGVLSLFF
ncbi:MAG: FIST C-terminal domain-containing protein [Dongiaceae bacterium]